MDVFNSCITIPMEIILRIFQGTSYNTHPNQILLQVHQRNVFCCAPWKMFLSPEYNADITIQIILGIYNKILQEGSSVFLHTLHRGRGWRRSWRRGSDREGQCFGCKRPQSCVPIWQRRIDSQCSYHSRIWSSCHQNPGNCLVAHNLPSDLSSMFWMTSLFKVPSFSSLYQSFTSLPPVPALSVQEIVNISTG